jgi:hypothetical protein
VLFADDAELLACMTRDALTGQLARWYWRQLAPTGPARIGAALAAAWTARVRWLPAALACLPAGDAERAVSTLSPAEAADVRRALVAEFAGPSGSAACPGPLPRADGPGAGLGDRRASVVRADPLWAGAGPRGHGDVPSAGPPAPWTSWLRVSWPLPPEQEALLGVAIALYAHPVRARRPAFLAAVEAWLNAPSRPPPASLAAPGAAPRGATPASGAVTAGAARDRAGPPAGPAGDSVRPATGKPSGGPTIMQAPAHPDPAQATGAARAAPAWTGAVSSQFASVLYLINLLGWLDLPGAWPEGAAPGGWAIIELLARHLLGDAAAPPGDPLWALLAELDGREPDVVAEAGTEPDDPARLPAGWLRRWIPPEASWEWAERRGRLVIADPDRDFVLADVPCATGHGATAAAAELARLYAAGVIGSLSRASQARPAPRPAGAPGQAQWRGTIGQFAAWLLASRDVRSSALSRPGRISVTRTHVDVILDLQHVDIAARVSGLDRDPGWVPDLGRIVAFHFEAEG